MDSYVPLRVRSYYSLLSGASSIDMLLEKAARSRIRTLALTDENNLYGAVAFFEKARERGVRPVLGCILDGPEGSVVLLVRDAAGYANLCELISGRHLNERFSLASAISEDQAGLFVLASDPRLVESLAARLDRGRLWVELVRPAASINTERRLLDTATRLGLGVVASADVFFADPPDHELHEALLAMRTGCPLSEARERAAPHEAGHLRTPEEFARLWGDLPGTWSGTGGAGRKLPGAVRATREIADECEFDLLGRKPVFPELPGDSGARLRTDALAGARGRYGKLTSGVRSRLDHELGLIARLGFADYFLVVADIVRHARELGTPVAGRGSGASSAVAYSLGITNVDPIRYHLPFARFLNEGRRDFPDLDIDFCWRLRDGVIDYVYRKHGDDHVAMIATYATMQPRLAFRESAKVLGLSNPVITEIVKRLHRVASGHSTEDTRRDRVASGHSTEDTRRDHGLRREEWGPLPAEPATVERAIRLARRLDGFPHHLAVHCGGVVITPGPISRHAPLQRAEKGVVITQYDKDGAEAVGLVKLDLLGNRALSSVGEAVRLVREGINRDAQGEQDQQDTQVEPSATHPVHPVYPCSGSFRLDPESLPERDPATERLLTAADTVGVNQLESPAMRHLLRQLRPRCVRDLMKVLALIRPGAASLGMKEAFVRRARGLDPVPPIDPRLDEILGETYGVMLYEDDALFIASALAGLRLDEADRFRRAVTKCRSDAERLRLSKDFLARCERNGTNPRTAGDLWIQMAKFNSYSFCRAHAASYARLAWANAYMKAHHPAEFWVGALNNNQSMYAHWVYLEEAKRAGPRVLLPCVNRSGEGFTLEDGNTAIRIGLGRIEGITARGRSSVLAARPFDGLTDLVARTALRIGEVENLVRAGALDFTGRPRPELLLELHLSFEGAKRIRGEGTLLPMARPAPRSVGLVPEGCPARRRPATVRDYSESQKWRDEWRMLGLSAGRHPVSWIRACASRAGALPSRAIPGRIGRRVKLAGLVAAMRTTSTAKGETMCFVTLADEWGTFEVTLFPDVLGRCRHELAEGGLGPLLVEGRVESQYDALSVTAERIEALSSRLRGKRRRKAARAVS